MSEKNRLAVRTEYFKKSQVDAERGHVERLFAENKNAFKELEKDNFGHMSEFDKRYKMIIEKLGKNAKKNSNVLIDSVLVLPHEQFEEMRNSFENSEDFQKAMKATVSATMLEMAEKMGFFPLGFEVHLDEGTKQEDGSIKLNPHIHMLFANYCASDLKYTKKVKRTLKDESGKALKDEKNPKKYQYQKDENGNIIEDVEVIDLQGKMPLQHYRGRGSDTVWSLQQDIAAKHFDKFGFKRGLSKELTQAAHKSKEQHIKDKLKKAEQEAIELEKQVEKAQLAEQEAIENRDKALLDNEILKSENTNLINSNSELRVEHKALLEAFAGIEEWANGVIHRCRSTLKSGINRAVNGFKELKSDKTRNSVLKQAETIEVEAFKRSPELRVGLETMNDTSIVEELHKVSRPKFR